MGLAGLRKRSEAECGACGGWRDFWMGWEVDFDCFFRYYSYYTLNMLTPLPVRTARSGWVFCFYVGILYMLSLLLYLLQKVNPNSSFSQKFFFAGQQVSEH